MRLEYTCYLSVRIEFAQRHGALPDLFRMMCVIAQVNLIGLFYMEIKTAVASAESCYTLAYHIVRCPTQLSHGHGSHRILNIYGNRYAKFNIGNTA